MTPPESAASGTFPALREYLAAPLGPHYSRLANRLHLYPVLVLLLFLESLLGWSLYQGPAFLLDRMAFTTVFSLHKALIYALCLCAADVMARYLPQQWGDWDHRSLGKQWLIWCAGFLLGFAVHRLAGLCLICFYAPEIMNFSLAFPQTRPGTATLLLFAVPSWFAAVFVTLQIAKDKRPAAPARAGDPPTGLGRGVHRQAPSQAAAQASADRPEAAPEGSLELWSDARPVRLAHGRITHVSVEDHYCRIFFTKEDGLGNLLVRLPLKNILQELPESSFLQIHRSHLVNLGHASGIIKKGRANNLALGRLALELPISRYRLAQVHARLQEKGAASRHGGPGPASGRQSGAGPQPTTNPG